MSLTSAGASKAPAKAPPAATISYKKVAEAGREAVSSVMESPLKLLIGLYLVMGLDEIGLLCMLLAYLGTQGCGLFDSIRSRLENPKLVKVTNDVQRGRAPVRQHFFVGAALLFGAVRQVGYCQQLPDTQIIADAVFIILGAITYKQWSATSKAKDAKAARRPVGRRQARPDFPPQPKATIRPNESERLSAGALAGRAGQAVPEAHEEACCTSTADLAEEIRRFVTNSMPRTVDGAVLRKLTSMAKTSIQKIVPEAEIRTVAHANLQSEHSEKDMPTHDLDCHMVVTCDPVTLAARLREYFMKADPARRKCMDKLLGPELRKCATKTLAQRLTFVNFWRSQYGGLDPMVVYMVPQQVCGYGNPIRLHFIVNCTYHLRFADVFAEGTRRAKELAVFANEWAKRRGLVNITKGHAHPYAWCLMALYFLRFEEKDTKSLLGTIQGFVRYLLQALHNKDESLSMHFTPGVTGTTTDMLNQVWGLPYIEDPFDPKQNVADTMTTDGIARVREELVRANAILAREDASLSELMERYIGPVAPPSNDVD